MQKPPHEETIELTQAQLEKGAREHEYSRILHRCRNNEMTDEEWQTHLLDDGFCAWIRAL